MGDSHLKGKELHKKSDAFNHRPWIIKFYGLLSAFVLTIACIVILEILVHVLPKGSQPYNPKDLSPFTKRGDVFNIELPVKRQSNTVVEPDWPCGWYLNTFSTPCLNYCRGHCTTAGCPSTVNATVCDAQCRTNGIWPYEAAPCAAPAAPSAPCGFSTDLQPTCRSYCAENGFNSTQCPSECTKFGIWPTLPKICPVAVAPNATCGFSNDTLSSDCYNHCSSMVDCEGDPTCTTTGPCSAKCTAAGIWPWEIALCDPVPPSAPCGFSNSTLTPGCTRYCQDNNPTGIFIPAADCADSCAFNGNIWPWQPLICLFSSSSSINIFSSTASSSLSSSSSTSLILSSPSSSLVSSTPAPSTSKFSSLGYYTNSSSSSIQSSTAPSSSKFSSSVVSSIASSIASSSVISIPSLIASSSDVFSTIVVVITPSAVSVQSSASVIPEVPSSAVLDIVSVSDAPISSAAPKASVSVPPVILLNIPSDVPVVSNAPASPSAVPPVVIVPVNNPAQPPLENAPPPPADIVPPPAGIPPPVNIEIPPTENAPPIVGAKAPPASKPPADTPPTIPAPPVTAPINAPPEIAPQPVQQGKPESTTPNPVISSPSGGGASGGQGDTSTQSFKSSLYRIPVTTTFGGGYAPVIVARLIAYAWTGIHAQQSLYQAFSSLAQPGGAPGTALLGSSVSSMWYSWIGYGAVIALTPLAPEILYLDTNYKCDKPDYNNLVNPCWPPKVSINEWPLRLAQGLLGLVAIATAMAAIRNYRKPSGLTADPTSIAATASVMGHPKVTQDFLALGPEASKRQLKEMLKDKQYKLDTYIAPSGAERYGLVPVVKDGQKPEEPNLRSLENGQQPDQVSTRSDKFTLLIVWKAMSTYIDGLFLLFVIGVLAICASYVKNVGNSRLAKLFQYSSIGRRMVFTVIGLIVTHNWGRLLGDTQASSPYVDLSRQEGKPRSTICLRSHTTALTALAPSLKNGHHTTAVVALTAILAEFLLVALSGLPYRPGQVQDEFFFCGISALIILAVMVLVIAFVAFWRRYLPHLPRKPDSTAAVMTYLAGSEMVNDFEGAERMKAKERQKWVEEQDNLYEYSLREGSDGRTRWTIDHTSKHDFDNRGPSIEVSWMNQGRVRSQFD